MEAVLPGAPLVAGVEHAPVEHGVEVAKPPLPDHRVLVVAHGEGGEREARRDSAHGRELLHGADGRQDDGLEEVEGQGGAGAGALAVPGGEVVGRELLGPRPAPLFVTNATGGGGNVRLLGRRRRARAGR